MKKDKLALALNQMLTSTIDMFFTSWIVMLLVGTLFGNADLWTPAYWEVFGGLYLLAVFTNFSTRQYYNSLKTLAAHDEVTSKKISKPTI